MEMTWNNYVLYLASIPGDDEETGVSAKGNRPETKDISELF